MTNNLKKLLPMLAVACLCVWAADVLVLGTVKASRTGGSPQNRSSAEQALAALQELRPSSPDDPAFRRAIDEVLGHPLIATVWLLSPDGRFLVSEGATAASTPVGSTVDELATNDVRPLIDVLPVGALSEEQRIWLLAASALRREGDHNDIYGHLLLPITGVDDSTVVLVGASYRSSEWVAGLGWITGVLLAGVSLLVYWLSLPAWVYLDALERGDRAIAWSMFVLFGNLIALLAYLLVRDPLGIPSGQEDLVT